MKLGQIYCFESTHLPTCCPALLCFIIAQQSLYRVTTNYVVLPAGSSATAAGSQSSRSAAESSTTHALTTTHAHTATQPQTHTQQHSRASLPPHAKKLKIDPVNAPPEKDDVMVRRVNMECYDSDFYCSMIRADVVF